MFRPDAVYKVVMADFITTKRHHQMDEKSLSIKMQEIGYKDILQTRAPLPNGKALIRMDFLKE